MLADAVQTFAVVLIVAAAIGYLVVYLRRSTCGRGCCGRDFPPRRPASPTSDESSGSQPFIPSENLADRARELAKKRDTTDSNE